MDAQFSSPLFSSAARNLIIYSLPLSLPLSLSTISLRFPRNDNSKLARIEIEIYTSMLNFERGEEQTVTTLVTTLLNIPNLSRAANSDDPRNLEQAARGF